MQNQWNISEAEKHEKDPVSLQSYAATLFESLSPELLAFSTVKVQSTTLFGEATTNLHGCQANKSILLNDPESLPLGALIHTCIPAQFVHQTRSASILGVANHADAATLVKELFEDRVWLASAESNESSLVEKIQTIELNDYDGIIIPDIGLISYSDDAKLSYDRTIDFHNKAEAYFNGTNQDDNSTVAPEALNAHSFVDLRKCVSDKSGHALVAKLDKSPEARAAISQETPFHNVPRTDGNHEEALSSHNGMNQVLWENHGIISFGKSKEAANQLALYTNQTCKSLELASAGGETSTVHSTSSLPLLPSDQSEGVLQGKIALVSGSAAGIGLATATTLAEAGAAVIGADINPEIESIMSDIGALGVTVDLTQEEQIESLVTRIVSEFGGLDIVVSNAGIFTAGAYLEDMEQSNWDRSMAVNLTSHQILLKHTIPYLKKGIDPSIIFIGSRNVNAPGAGAASYSCAKAGLTQLCRVAALELAPEGVRVNIIHPDAVFDTKLWTQEALERSAERYGLTVEQYKKRNLMKTEITSRSVGNTVVAVASDAFAKTTGAQIPVDGGNDRII